MANPNNRQNRKQRRATGTGKKSATTSRGTKTVATLTPNTSHNNSGNRSNRSRGLTRIQHQLTISPAATAISSSNPLNRITEPMAISMGRRVA